METKSLENRILYAQKQIEQMPVEVRNSMKNLMNVFTNISSGLKQLKQLIDNQKGYSRV